MQHRDTVEALARDLMQKRFMRAAQIEPWLRDVYATPAETSAKARPDVSKPTAQDPPNPS